MRATVSSYDACDIIEFGWYPQSRVYDATILAALNLVQGEWTSYNYYTGTGDSFNGRMQASDFMRYLDVVYEGNRYRGVIFDDYRPYWTGLTSSADSSAQDTNYYFPDTVYWFRYDPIKWRVLNSETGMVISELAIDSQAFNNYMLRNGKEEGRNYDAHWGDPRQTYYANNYANSSIRQWLNNDFFNTAFSCAQKNIINETVLDNSAFEGDTDIFDAASTTDKIYLISCQEFKDYKTTLTTNGPRLLNFTEYTKCQGGFIEQSYLPCLTRSAADDSRYVMNMRYTSYSNVTMAVDTSYGIRPALNLDLTKEIVQTPILDLKNHSYTSSVTTQPTHMKEGVKTYTCSDCGDSYTEAIEKTATHTHVPTITAPTCTEGGFTTYTCECGDSYTADVTPATGHHYAESERNEPGCEEDGYILFVCPGCGDTKTEVLPATGHHYAESERFEPFCDEDGYILFVCPGCGDTETQVLPATGHNDTDSDGECDSCGTTMAGPVHCSCLCHSTSFLRIIWIIVRFFWQLFNMNPVCECGVAHW